MGVHVTNPKVRTILDIGGQDIKGITVDADGTVKNFVMNDKCAAGTGKFLDNIARTFGMSLSEFAELSMKGENPIPITAQCSVFAESEVISLVGQKKSQADIAAGILQSMAKRCYTMLLKAGIEEDIITAQIYPNPADDFIKVLLKGSAETVDTQLRTLQGAEIKDYSVNKRVNGIDINVSQVAPGAYVLRIILSDGTIINKKVFII